METKANYVAVGAFVLVCVFGLVVALLWLAGAQYSEEFAYYRTYFTGSVTGLGDGTVVRYNGIQVGSISKIDFDPDNPKRVIVTLQIKPTLNIPVDSEASIASEGITGGTYVEIDGGSKNAAVFPHKIWGEYPVIKSKPSTLQQLEQSAPELVAKLSHAADQLNDLLNAKNRAAVAGILTDLHQTLDAVDKHNKDIEATLVNVSSATSKLNADLTDLHGVLGSANASLGKIDHLADDADSAVNSAQFGQMSTQIRTLATSLTRLSNQLEHEPTRLLFGDRRKGYTPP
ncbi:MAG: MlaD family protein [Rhizomicrobium sp.]|jgi:phospholipid/cholesterol/gamma-HCH transport system substrate-binding protein